MDYREKNGFSISELGLGCYSLSGAYGKKDHQTFIQCIQSAYDNGINFFDTADTYGDSAEEILGQAVKSFRNKIYLATKVGIREGKKPTLNKHYVITACENSLRRLNTEYIDLYQVHFDDPSTPVSETLSALDILVKQGKIRKYGLGHLSMQKIQAYHSHGEPFSVLFELSAVARESLDDVLPYCRENNMAAIAFSPTGRGILTGKIDKEVTFEPGDIRILDPLFQRERLESALRITKKFKEIGQDYGKTSTQVAINWVLSQPGITCALTGTSSIQHLQENIGGTGWQLDKVSLERIKKVIDQEESRLRIHQLEALEQLLSGDLNSDPMQAFLDLIYIIETSILLKIVKEETLYPVFLNLFQYRDNLNPTILPELKRIHQILKDEINLSSITTQF